MRRLSVGAHPRWKGRCRAGPGPAADHNFRDRCPSPLAGRWWAGAPSSTCSRVALHDPGCQAFCIYGPSGVGKTRLGDECPPRRRGSRASGVARHGRPLRTVPCRWPPSPTCCRCGPLTDWPHGDDGGSASRARGSLDARRGRWHRPVGPPVHRRPADRRRPPRRPIVAHRGRPPAGERARCSVSPRSTTARPGARDRDAVVARRAGDADRPRRARPRSVSTRCCTSCSRVRSTHAASDELWRASQGNLLILHELVLGALADGCSPSATTCGASTGRSVRRTGSVTSSPGASTHWRPTDGPCWSCCALCQPVGVGQLESSFGLEVLEALERDGLIAARRDGRRQSVSLAHPLHREVLRARWRPSEPGSILSATPTRWSGAVPVVGTTRSASPRSGSKPPVRPIPTCSCAPPVWRAPTTTCDRRPTRRGALAARSTAAAGSSSARRSTASARSRRPRPPSPPPWTRRRSEVDGRHRDRSGAATCSSVAAATTRPRRSWRTVAARGLSASAADGAARRRGRDAGLLRRPARTPSPCSREWATSPVIGVLVAAPRSAALAMIGRTAEALGLSRRADHELALGDPLRSRPGRPRVDELFALVQAGRLGEADDGSRPGSTPPSGPAMPLDVMWLAVHLARGALAQGRPVTALGWVEPGVHRHRRPPVRRAAPDRHGGPGRRPRPARRRCRQRGRGRRARRPDGRASAPSPSRCRSAGRGRWSPPVTSDRRGTCSSPAPMTPRPRASCPPRGGCSTTPLGWAPPTGWRSRLAALAAATDSELVRRPGRARRRPRRRRRRPAHRGRRGASRRSAPTCSPPRPRPRRPRRGGAWRRAAGDRPRRLFRPSWRQRLRGRDVSGAGSGRHRGDAHQPRARRAVLAAEGSPVAPSAPSSRSPCAPSTTTSVASTSSSACPAGPSSAARARPARG